MNRRLREPVVFESYTESALARECRACGATPGVWCNNRITGRVRRIPCPARVIPRTADAS